MFDLRKLFAGGRPEALAPALAAAVDAWRAMPEPSLDELHFHQRYVVLDIVTRRCEGEPDRLQALGAVAITGGGHLPAGEAVCLEVGEGGAVDPAALFGLLEFLGKAPMVVYHARYVTPLVQQLMRQRLGVEFEPRQIDLAWLLPALFAEKSPTPVPLDDWLAHFNSEFGGRRELMVNVLELARLFQRALARAGARSLDTAAALVLEADASNYLRRTV